MLYSKKKLKMMYADTRLNIEDLSSSEIALLPRSKFDIESIKHLKNTNYQDIRSVLPFLIGWMQNQNWPIARPMGEFLSTFGEDIIPEVKWIFERSDDEWKFCCICGILNNLSYKIIAPLIPFLKRFAENPTDGEVEQDVHTAAKECLRRFG